MPRLQVKHKQLRTLRQHKELYQSTNQGQGTGSLDLTDEDDAAMQQALWQSRQQAQMQGI